MYHLSISDWWDRTQIHSPRSMGNEMFRFLASTVQEGTLEEAGTDREGHSPQHPLHLLSLPLDSTPSGNLSILPRFSGTLIIQ